LFDFAHAVDNDIQEETNHGATHRNHPV
jgi:hypothetical protein